MGVSRCDGFVRAAKRGVIEESEHASRLLHEWRRYFLGVGRHERRPLGPPRPAASRPRLESRTRHVPPRAATGTRARLMLLQSASPRLIELEGAWSPLVAS